MNAAPTRKVTAGALGSATGLLLIWGCNAYLHANIDAVGSAAITGFLSALFAYLTKEPN